jgi:hypothetical protein
MEFQHPEIQAGAAEEGEKQQLWTGMSQMAVQETIQVIRQLAKDGQLDG